MKPPDIKNNIIKDEQLISLSSVVFQISINYTQVIILLEHHETPASGNLVSSQDLLIADEDLYIYQTTISEAN
jgi:hypothetical protein